MNILFVVSQLQDWAFDIPGITIVPARTYLMEPAYGDCNAARVFNLCRNYRYQQHGYYVSLLAEARGHQPLPNVEASRDLQTSDLAQHLSEKLGQLMDCTFSQIADNMVDLDIYFGKDSAHQYEHLCTQIFKLLHAPILHVRFERAHKHWQLSSAYIGDVRDIPPHRHEAFTTATLAYLKEEKILSGARGAKRRTLAILHDPLRAEAPSNRQALQKFCDAAETLGITAHLITPNQARHLDAFDALFIRDTTSIDHLTYQLSRQAADAGMVVIDDPDSIMRCTNKIYLAELLMHHHIPIPKTLVVHKDNIDSIIPALGLPCVLKQPDGAFSLGVVKVESAEHLHEKVNELLEKSELILAQEYLPTAFDWRIGVLDRRPLFVCKYHMAPGHWQIIKHGQETMSEGDTEALCISETPDEAINIAVQAANLIGDGFYGVDIKQVGTQYYVIEVNDNPNVDTGNEDGILGDALYREVMGVFRKRIDALKGN